MQNQQTANSLKVYETAKAAIGTMLVPPELAVLGCAATVNQIFQNALGAPIGGGPSTFSMMPFLTNPDSFTEVEETACLPGDVIISPTGYANPVNPNMPHGHVGIVAMYGILSNSSGDGRLHENYDLTTWKERYAVLGGYPVRFFRVK